MAHGHAYLGRRGPRTAALALIEQVKAATAEFGTVTVVLFDLVRAFRSLSAFAAIERARTWGMSGSILDALRVFYLMVLENPLFDGLQEGPPTSPILSEIALAPLDEFLRVRSLAVVRFSDNIGIVLPSRADIGSAKGIVSTVVEEFRSAEQVNLAVHDWRLAVATEEGFQSPLAWLAYEWAGWECHAPEARLLRHERALGERAREDGPEAAHQHLNGILAYYRGVVSMAVLADMARRLRWAVERPGP